MLSSVDWILLVVLMLSALFGALRGFVAEVLSMVVWIVAFWLAFVYGADVAQGLQGQIDDAAGRLLLAYALVFIAAMVAGSVVSWIVARAVRSLGLGGVDSFFGFVYGLVRGALLGCVLVLVLGWTALPREAQWRASPLIPIYQAGAETMRQWLPDAASRHLSFAAVVDQGRQKVMQAVTEQALPALAGNAPQLPGTGSGADGPASSASPEAADVGRTEPLAPAASAASTAAGRDAVKSPRRKARPARRTKAPPPAAGRHRSASGKGQRSQP